MLEEEVAAAAKEAPPRQDGAPGVAVFDLDCTLTRRDTMLPWLILLRGRARVATAITFALRHVMPMLRRSGALRPGLPVPVTAVGLMELERMPFDHLRPDLGSRVKASVYRQLLGGIPVPRALAAAEELGRRVAWNPDMAAALERHRDSGHRVVVATGCASLCARTLIERRFGIREVLGTELEAQDGVLTGRLATPNCVRAYKAERVGAWLETEGPFGESWGYGNKPHDLPMLALLDNRTIV